jgi:hypothetical protein
MILIPVEGYSIAATYNKMSVETFSYTDRLKSIKIDRAGENSKFFGFGVPQKMVLNVLDNKRELTLNKDTCIKAYFNINNNEFVNNFSDFYITDVKRNENTNELTIECEDKLFKANNDTVSILNLTSYTIRQFAEAIAAYYGLTLEIRYIGSDSCFDREYTNGANFEGTESIREALDAIAEATQTIYFICGDTLIFKRLNLAPAADLNIEKQHYFSLTSKEPYKLGAICHITELGDNVSSASIGGVTQYIRNNPFWELEEDIGDLIGSAALKVWGMSITPFTCSWRGNFLAEIGDKLCITAKDGNTISTYLLNDSIVYNGGYSHITQWSYEEANETPSNPATLGEALKETFARVDKVKKQIDIVASEAEDNKTAIAALQINENSINASVTRIEGQIADATSSTSESIAELTRKVDAQITAEDVTLSIKSALESGVDRVETATGFKFNEEGLTVSKSGSEISTQITEDGMNIKKGSTEVLTANNEGVKAQDLHATTYLIIGENSRFEDFGNRTACFWIGGNS